MAGDNRDFEYDDNGNQTERDTDTFAYDHENRLTQTVIGGVTSSSVYNGDGLGSVVDLTDDNGDEIGPVVDLTDDDGDEVERVRGLLPQGPKRWTWTE